ncbi:MAG: hypothetical protein ACKVQA_26160 [Burkholderiales bacterium]
MRVLDVAVADQAEPIRELVRTLLDWLKQINASRFVPSDEARIARSLRQLRRAMHPFHSVAGVSIATPKYHRAEDVFSVICQYGGARHVSTDTYEMAHKALKSVMRRCVLFDVLCSSWQACVTQKLFLHRAFTGCVAV